MTLFPGTVRPIRLKLGTHVDSGQMCIVYRNQDADAAYSSLNFSVTLFSGTMMPTHVDNGWVYCINRNQVAAAYSSLFSSFFVSPIFKQ